MNQSTTTTQPATVDSGCQFFIKADWQNLLRRILVQQQLITSLQLRPRLRMRVSKQGRVASVVITQFEYLIEIILGQSMIDFTILQTLIYLTHLQQRKYIFNYLWYHFDLQTTIFCSHFLSSSQTHFSPKTSFSARKTSSFMNWPIPLRGLFQLSRTTLEVLYLHRKHFKS